MTWLWTDRPSGRATCFPWCHQHTPISAMDLILVCSLAPDHTTVGDVERKMYSAPLLVRSMQWCQLNALCGWHPKWQHQYLRLQSQRELPTTCSSLALGLPRVNGSLLNISLFKMAFGNQHLLFFQWIHLSSWVVCTSASPLSGFAFVVTLGESLWKMLCYITLPPGSNELLRKSRYC